MSQQLESQSEAPESTIGFIMGRIIDERGNPLEGVRITTNDSGTYSDAEGNFVIGDRPCLNPHQLMAYLEGFAVNTQKLTLRAGKRREVELMLLKIPVCLSGVVKDCKTLTALAGVRVCLGSPCQPYVDTLSDGSYKLCDEPGTYPLTATKAEYRPYNNSGNPVRIPRASDKNFCMRKL